MKTISPKEVHQRLNDPDAMFLDVRTPAEIRECSVGECTCVPHDKVAHCPDLDQLPRDQAIVLICGSGQRATGGDCGEGAGWKGIYESHGDGRRNAGVAEGRPAGARRQSSDVTGASGPYRGRCSCLNRLGAGLLPSGLVDPPGLCGMRPDVFRPDQ